jgi:hypothetical protein
MYEASCAQNPGLYIAPDIHHSTFGTTAPTYISTNAMPHFDFTYR